MTTPRLVLLLLAFASAAAFAQQPSGDDMNTSNNPLSPMISFNLHDQYIHEYYGLGDEDANYFLLRGSVPHRLFGATQLFRYTMPIVTTPDISPPGRKTGAGDLNLINWWLFKEGSMQLGFGPQLTLPTASRDETGTGKWQAGLSGLLIAPQKWGLAGLLLTWQESFAGDSDRAKQNNFQLQPFFIHNLPGGWYLRSTATMTWDLERHTRYLPVGLGAGKVWKSGRETYNIFVEPQWTVDHRGTGVPKVQLYFGLNIQFPI